MCPWDDDRRSSINLVENEFVTYQAINHIITRNQLSKISFRFQSFIVVTTKKSHVHKGGPFYQRPTSNSSLTFNPIKRRKSFAWKISLFTKNFFSCLPSCGFNPICDTDWSYSHIVPCFEVDKISLGLHKDREMEKERRK